MKYLGFLLLVLSGYVMAEEVYYCSDNDANGFNQKNGVYKPALITLEKFKMKLQDDGDIVIENGGQVDLYICSQPYPYDPPYEAMSEHKNKKSCVDDRHNGWLFNFNQDNGRYILFAGLGYVFGDGDSVITHIGTCTKF